MRAFNPPDWSAARKELRRALTSSGWHPDTIHDAELALHELYFNAWRHADCQAPLVIVTLLPRTLRVCVCDDSPTLPESPFSSGPFEVSGRGLHLVRALTHRFGADPTKNGKVVWYELDAAA
ncbi:ATP-binding protein [Kitasatospora sp. NPDC058406]|uniref:ATP-binding protein n=1 Tax=Kitasatospora sp. NPDC058406 TaxID=3346483 RepID=UPI003657EE35